MNAHLDFVHDFLSATKGDAAAEDILTAHEMRASDILFSEMTAMKSWENLRRGYNAER
jgi:hypothetical protein